MFICCTTQANEPTPSISFLEFLAQEDEEQWISEALEHTELLEQPTPSEQEEPQHD